MSKRVPRGKGQHDKAPDLHPESQASGWAVAPPEAPAIDPEHAPKPAPPRQVGARSQGRQNRKIRKCFESPAAPPQGRLADVADVPPVAATSQEIDAQGRPIPTALVPRIPAEQATLKIAPTDADAQRSRNLPSTRKGSDAMMALTEREYDMVTRYLGTPGMTKIQAYIDSGGTYTSPKDAYARASQAFGSGRVSRAISEYMERRVRERTVMVNHNLDRLALNAYGDPAQGGANTQLVNGKGEKVWIYDAHVSNKAIAELNKMMGMTTKVDVTSGGDPLNAPEQQVAVIAGMTLRF